MAAYYFDTSALVKRYAQETGSSWVVGITDPAANNEVFISIATGAEMAAALPRKPYRPDVQSVVIRSYRCLQTTLQERISSRRALSRRSEQSPIGLRIQIM